MADLLLCVLLLVVGTPPSTTTSCADKLVSFSTCISSPPINISGSPLIQCCDNFAVAINYNTTICLCYLVHDWPILGLPINSTKLSSLFRCFSSPPNNISGLPPSQCCDDFAAAFNDNSAIRLYCVVDNPPIVGFSINSTELISLASGYQVNEKEGGKSLSLESQFSAGLSSSLTLLSYYGWLLCAALVCYYVEYGDYRAPRRLRLPRLSNPHIEQANVDGDLSDSDDDDDGDDDGDDDDDDDDDDVPHVIPIFGLIGNVDIIVATVDMAGCIGFTSFAAAVKLSHPGGGDAEWHGCVLWPWRGDIMNYMTEHGQLLDPLRNTWIEFSEQLSFIRVTLQEEEPTIGLLFHDIDEYNELAFDVLLPTRYANISTSFATALHYIWSAWNELEPFPFDQLDQINIAFGLDIHYFSMNNLPLLPPPLLPLPANLEDWNPFITALSYITILA